MKNIIFSKKNNNSEFDFNSKIFNKNSLKIEIIKPEEEEKPEKLSNAYKNINNLLSNCIESIRVNEKDIETINSPVLKNVSSIIKKNKNVSSNKLNKIIKNTFKSNTKKSFNLNKSNSLSNSNNNLMKSSEDNLMKTLNNENDIKKKNISRKKTSPLHINKAQTNKTIKPNSLNLKNYIITDDKLNEFKKNNTILLSNLKVKNSKSGKFLFGQRDSQFYKKKNTVKLEKKNVPFTTKDINKNLTLHSKKTNISNQTNQTIKAKVYKNFKNNEINGISMNFNSNIETYSPKSIKINKSKKNKKVTFQEKKIKRRKNRLKTFEFFPKEFKNELAHEIIKLKKAKLHSTHNIIKLKDTNSEQSKRKKSLKRPNTTILNRNESIFDNYVKKSTNKSNKVIKTSKKNMKILTIEQIGKNVKQSLIGFNLTEVKKELYDLEFNDIAEEIKKLPTKKINEDNINNEKNENIISKKDTNKKESTLNTSLETKNQKVEESNKQINKFQQKYRKLFVIKKVYDSLDDEELGDEEEIFFFYISPHSFTIYFIDSLVFISAFLELFYLPIYLGYKLNFCRNIFSFESLLFYCFDFIYIMDLLTGFFRAYYNFEEFLIKNNVDICIHYLKGWFFFDFIEAIPFYTIFNFNEMKCSEYPMHLFYSGDFINFHYSLLIIKILKIFKAFSHNKALNKLIDILNRNDFFNNWNGVFFTLLVTLSLIHFCSCFFIYLGRNFYPGWIIVQKIQDKGFLYIYVNAVYYLITTITTVGYGDLVVLTTYERIYQILLLIIGTCAYSWIVTFISNYIKKMNEQYIDFENKVKILGDIRISYPLLKKDLYEKIIRYLKYNKSENKYNVDYILDSLPLSLKNNVIIDMYKPIIKNFQFFKSFQNSDFFVKIVTSLKPVLSMKDDILVQEGDVIEDIIFIKKGVLSLEICIDLDCPQESCEAHLNPNGYSTIEKTNKGFNTLTSSNNNYSIKNTPIKSEIIKSNKKQMNIINLRKNEHYGDILMILNERSPLTVKVKSKKAELFFLQKTDATEISNKYPNIWKRIVHKSLFNMKQIKNLIRKKIIIFCDLNGIWINPELRKNSKTDASDLSSYSDTLFLTNKNKKTRKNSSKKNIKKSNTKVIYMNKTPKKMKSNFKKNRNKQIETIIYEEDENIDSNRNSFSKNNINNNSEKSLYHHKKDKTDKNSEMTSLFSSNNNKKSGLKDLLNKSVASNNSFKNKNVEKKDSFLTFNSHSKSSSSNSDNNSSIKSSNIKVDSSDQIQSFQESDQEKETGSDKIKNNHKGNQNEKNLSLISNKINKMLTAINKKIKPNEGKINNLNINFITHKTFNLPMNHININRRNSEPVIYKKGSKYTEESDEVNEEIYSDEDFNINIGKQNLIIHNSDKNNNILYPYLNDSIIHKNNINNFNLSKLLDKKSNTSLIKDDNNSKISKNSDLIKSSRFSNLYNSTSVSFTINSIYENVNKLTGYRIQKDLFLQQKLKNYILDECFFQTNSINYGRNTTNYKITSTEDKKKTLMNNARNSLQSRNSKFSKSSSIVGNVSSCLPFYKMGEEESKHKKIRTRNSVKVRKKRIYSIDNNSVIKKFHQNQKSIEIEKSQKNHKRKRRNTNVFRQQIGNNNNASALNYSNISNIHAIVPQEETSFLKKKTAKRPALKLNDDEEMSFYTKMKTIRNMKNNTNIEHKSFIAKPKEFSLMDKITQNIQKNKQNLNNPEEYFSGFFTNLLQRKKTIARPGRTKKNAAFIKRTSTSSEAMSRNSVNFKFNI